MRIVVDAMGSDSAPGPDVEGAIWAARKYDVAITLVGEKEIVQQELSKYDTAGLDIEIVHASDVITMSDHPAMAVRAKPDSSMVVAMGLVRDGQADAFVSAGNSGGVLATALLSRSRLGRVKGIRRPAISTVLPTRTGKCFILDIGANTDCKPDWLFQFAHMGSIYAERVLEIPSPRVALLSNGEEDTKGNEAVIAAHELLKGSSLNFVGNVEGKGILSGYADVIVADGFVGNVAIKTAEGVSNVLLSALKEYLQAGILTSLGALLAKPAFNKVKGMLDYREYGGGPLLGVNGVVIIAHGRSDALAIQNAVRVAREAVQQKVVDHIREGLGSIALEDSEEA